jgi:PadR family transcriptional regulator PadR
MGMGCCSGFSRSRGSSWRSSRGRSLYPALARLEHQGWIASEWGESENKRRAKFYSLTATGRKQLQVETTKWNKMAELVAGILKTTREEL